MTVRLAEDGAIMLEGHCPADDAEAFVRLLLLDPGAEVDWRGCDEAHAAVVQVLLAARPVMRGPPRSAFLRTWIETALSPSKP